MHVRGNADRLVLSGGEGAIGDWSARRLGERRAAVAAWPLTLELDVDGLGRVLVCHATPTSDEPIYTRVTPDEDVAQAVRGRRTPTSSSAATRTSSTTARSRAVFGSSIRAAWACRTREDAVRSGRCSGPTSSSVPPSTTSRPQSRRCASAGAPNVEEQLITYLLEPPDPTTSPAYFESLRAA